MQNKNEFPLFISVSKGLSVKITFKPNVNFFITYLGVQQLIRSSAKNQSKGINIRHASKLEALCNGKRFDVNYLNVDKIVVNTDVHLLSRGLAFSIIPQQLDRIDIQTSFESFYHRLSTGQPESNLSHLKQRLRGLCFSYFYGFKKNNCSNLSKDELSSLKNLLKRKTLCFVSLIKVMG